MILYTSLIVFVLYLFMYGDTSLHALWMGRFCVLTILVSLLFSYDVAKKTTMWALPIVAYVIISGLITSFWFPVYSNEPFEVQSPLRQSSTMGLIYFVFCTYFVANLSKEYVRFIGHLFGYATIPMSLLIISADKPEIMVPIINNPSMAGSLVIITACLLPRFKIAGWTAAILAAFMTRASSPVLCLTAVIVTRLFMKKPSMGIAAILISPFAYVRMKDLGIAMTDNGRFAIWGHITEWWYSQSLWKVMFGNGLSTTRVLAQVYQETNNFMTDSAIFWLHNDWIQTMIELGVVGLACALILFVRMFYYLVVTDSIDRRHYLPALMAYSACMVVNYPGHWLPHSFLGFIIVRMCI